MPATDITVSDRAARRILEIRAEQQQPDKSLLSISVRSGGCSGLTYDLDFVEERPPQKTEKEFLANGIRILIDMRSLLYLTGTHLDYTDGLTGKGFYFQNPNAARTCSCGESFSL